jgi:hypothetical protein
LALNSQRLLRGAIGLSSVREACSGEVRRDEAARSVVESEVPPDLGTLLDCASVADGPTGILGPLWASSYPQLGWWIPVITVFAALVYWGWLGRSSRPAGPLGWVQSPLSAGLGLLHTAGYVGASFLASYVVLSGLGGSFGIGQIEVDTSHDRGSLLWLSIRAGHFVALFVISWILSGLVLGVYLFIASLLRLHANDASVAIVEEGWKNFARIELNEIGAEIFLVKLEDLDGDIEIVALPRMEFSPTADQVRLAVVGPSAVAVVRNWVVSGNGALRSRVSDGLYAAIVNDFDQVALGTARSLLGDADDEVRDWAAGVLGEIRRCGVTPAQEAATELLADAAGTP